MVDNRYDRPNIDGEIQLRRLTIEEASFKLEIYIDDAFMAGFTRVRVIHGKGTGTLREAIHQQLKHHPLIKSFRLGNYGEGGMGVTIVELFHR